MKHLTVVAIAFALLCSCASSTPESASTGSGPQRLAVELGDGTEIIHEFFRRQPLPAENEWVKSEVAGLLTGPGENGDPRLHIIYAFTLSVYSDELQRIVLTDVTDKEFKVIADETAPQLKDGRWMAQSEKILASRENVPWVYEEGITIKVFRYELFNRAGEKKVLYQPSVYNQQTKNQLKAMFSNG